MTGGAEENVYIPGAASSAAEATEQVPVVSKTVHR